MDRVGRELVGAIAGNEEQRASGSMAGQLADDLEAHLVGPVEIIENEHRRPIDRLQDPVGRRANDEAARAERVAIVPAVDRQKVLGQAAEGFVAPHAGGHLADRGKRHLKILRRHGSAVDPEPGCLRLADRGAQQPRFAEASLSRQEERVTAAFERLARESVEQAEQVVAADQDRAHDCGCSTHGAESTGRRLWVIGRTTDTCIPENERVISRRPDDAEGSPGESLSSGQRCRQETSR